MLSFSPLPKFSPLEFEDAQIFCVRSSPDNSFYVAGLSNGQVALISPTTGRLSYTIQISPENLPITSIRYHPLKPKHFIASSAEGIISEFSTKTSQTKKTWTIQEEKNEIYAMDITNDGKKFATAGQDKVIRIYDYETQQLSMKLYKVDDDETSNGHTNRIYSLLFSPQDPHVLVSAGWDDTVQFWDTRAKESIHHIFGPHVCSDTLDIHDHTLLTGSMRTINQLQLFDMRTFDQIANIKWSKQNEERQCLIYTCKFHPNGDFIIAGGSGDTKVRAFSTKTFAPAGKSAIFSSPIYSISLTPKAESILIGTQDGHFYTHNLQFTRN